MESDGQGNSEEHNRESQKRQRHMHRMEDKNEERAIIDMIVLGKRPRGRPRGRWMDCVGRDMQGLGITQEDAQDRTFWKSRIRPWTPPSGKGEENTQTSEKL